MKILIVILSLSLLFSASGCGYTTKSLLPSNIKTICVENFTNTLALSAPVSDERMYRGYRPNMEYEITKRVVDRFLYDGTLKVVDAKDADLILKGDLVDYRKEALMYDDNDNVEEFRVRLVVNLEMYDAKNKKVMWKENNFAGETTYRTTGTLAQTEQHGIDTAEYDLARRIVERTVEVW